MNDSGNEASASGRTPPSDELKHLAAAEAALMLLESVMLALAKEGIIPVEKLVEAIEIVIDTKRDFVAAGAHPEISEVAIGLLSNAANSLGATRA